MIPKTSPSSKPPAGEEQVRMDVNKIALEKQPFEPSSAQAKSVGDFDDLEHWGLVPVHPAIEELPAEVAPVPVVPANPPELVAEAATLPQITPDTERTAEVKYRGG